MTFALFAPLTGAVQSTGPGLERAQAVRDLLLTLPKANYDLLVILMAHLVRVMAYGEVNKMSARNLGVVFGPTLLRSPDDGAGLDIAGSNGVIETMLLHFDFIFQSTCPSC